MPIVATVTRASVSRFFSQQSGVSPGDHGGNAFTLRKANGESLGTYRSVSEAQGVFTQFHGSNRILKWEQRDLAGAVEQHVCIGTPIDPSEIWVLQPGSPQVPNSVPVTSLVNWVQPSVSLGSVKLSNVTTNTITRISDLSGSDNFYIGEGAKPPILIESDPAYNERPSVDLQAPDAQGFSVPNLTALALPWTMVLVANNLDPGGSIGLIVEVDGGGAATFSINDDGAGLWEATVGVSSVVGPSSAPVSILTAKATSAGVDFRVDGVAVGTVPVAPDTGAFKIGGFDAVAWTGRFSAVMVANIADADNTRILQTERYFRELFQ